MLTTTVTLQAFILAFAIGAFSGLFQGALRVVFAISAWCVVLTSAAGGQEYLTNSQFIAIGSLICTFFGTVVGAILYKRILPSYSDKRFQLVSSMVGISLLSIFGALASLLSNEAPPLAVAIGASIVTFSTGYIVLYFVESKKKIHHKNVIAGVIGGISFMIALVLACRWPIVLVIWIVEAWCGALCYATIYNFRKSHQKQPKQKHRAN